ARIDRTRPLEAARGAPRTACPRAWPRTASRTDPGFAVARARLARGGKQSARRAAPLAAPARAAAPPGGSAPLPNAADQRAPTAQSLSPLDRRRGVRPRRDGGASLWRNRGLRDRARAVRR